MSARRRLAFAAVVAAQAIVLLGLVGLKESALAAGQKIQLKAEPVDPRDPFRGEYVALTYGISRLPAPPGARVDDVVYVPLYEGADAWSGTAAMSAPPGGADAFIQGRVVSVERGRAHIEYGIETYYVEEGEGAELEQAIFRDALYVDVVLDENGRAAIEDVTVRVD